MMKTLSGAYSEFDGDDEASALRRVVEMCGRLSVFASQEADLSWVVRVLIDTVGCGAAVVDNRLEVLACAGVEEAGLLSTLRLRVGAAALDAGLTAVARNRRALTVPALSDEAGTIVLAPVIVGEQVGATLLTVNGAADGLSEDMQLLATEHAAMVAGVVLGRDLVVTAASRKARRDLVEGLLSERAREDEELDRWARHLGLERDREYVVVSVAVSDAGSAVEESVVESLLGRHAPEAVVATRTDEVVAIVPVVGDTASGGPAQLLARACAQDQLHGQHIAGIGVGNACADVAGIARSYTEARRALAAGQRMGRTDTPTVFAELGIHRLLLRVPDVNELRSFAREVLGPLLEEERAHGVEYLATLSTYFHEGGSPRRVARRLYLHPNTVSYRIRRIEQITGLALSVHRERLMAEVAVDILDCLGGMHEPAPDA